LLLTGRLVEAAASTGLFVMEGGDDKWILLLGLFHGLLKKNMATAGDTKPKNAARDGKQNGRA